MNLNIGKAYTHLQKKLDTWLNELIINLPDLIMAMLTLIIFYLVARLIRKLVMKTLHKFSRNNTISRLLANSGYASIVILGLFTALEILDLDKTVTSLLAGAGILGLALGFAFKDIASNYMSGILMAIQQPFKAGDIIETSEYFGTVQSLDLRTTNLETFDGQFVMIPNNKVFTEALTNYTVLGRRRIDLLVGISYAEHLDQVKNIVEREIRHLPFIHPQYPVEVFFWEFGDSSVNFKLRFWIRFSKLRQYFDARSQAVMTIRRVFRENDITIPFPIRTLDFGIKGGKDISEMQLHTTAE